MSIPAFPAAVGRSVVNESIIPSKTGASSRKTDPDFPEGIRAESLFTATQTRPGEGRVGERTHF
ncbi:hypothetical protein [Rhizobium freirei]|uniref:hypothetical protein n=1 Tax=Rhizobium freirei TaxID=1353277 RepID=UPI0012FAA461|nr:hypothetical protein [Rhizobium freirei]